MGYYSIVVWTPITRTLTTDLNLMLTREGAYFFFEKQPNVKTSCRLKCPSKNCRQMSGKSKASDRTNLATSAAPIYC